MLLLPFTHSWIKTFLLLPCCLDGQAWLAAAAALAGRLAGATAAPASAGRLASPGARSARG